MDTISDPNAQVTRESDGSITIDGKPLNNLKSEIKEAEESGSEDSFVIESKVEEIEEVEEDEIFGSPEDILTDWYDNLKIQDQQKLNNIGIKSANDLIKESKKNSYVGTTEEFIDEIKQCFL